VQDWKVSCPAAFQQTEVCLSPEDYFQDHFTFEWVCMQHETKYTQAVHNKSACYEAIKIKLGRPGLRIYIPQEQGDPVIPLLAGFAFCCLLRLAGLPTVEVFMGRCVLLT
jgi:hypothetical protein